MRRTKPDGAYVGKEDAFQESAIALVRTIAQANGVNQKAVMHIPNGGQRNAIVGAKLKAMGTVPGYPDIMVFHPESTASLARRDGWGDQKVGLAIELKVWPNKPTEEQLAIHDLLRMARWLVVVHYGLGEVETAVKEYLG